MRNALKNLAIVISLISTLNVTALAIPIKEKLQLQKESLTKIQHERQEIESNIEQFDNEIEKSMTKIQENKGKIYQTEKEIIRIAAEVKVVEKEAEKEQKLFNSRMRIMYISGFDGYASVLLSAESLGDFVRRIESIKTIIEYDEKVASEFENTKNQLNEKHQSLNKTKEVLLSLQAENKQKLEKIILAKEAQNKLITELNIKVNPLGAQRGNNQLSANRIITIDGIEKLVAKSTLSRGAANLSEEPIIAYASRLIGTPYLWGGTSPSKGFDCSGFTQYVYKHFEINLGRSTFDQIKEGVQVSKNNLKPGDLVFFGKGSNPQHTGIYIGENYYIHSPRTGDVIKISPMTRGDYIAARRVR